QEVVAYPKWSARITDASVPQVYRDDLNEAGAVVHTSPRASAALTRRLLQTVLREHFKIQYPDLVNEIDEFLKRPDLPADLRGSVDAIRNVGNFAAHPMKSKQTGQIVEVEPGEAEWLLETCEWLLDYAFVGPAVLSARQSKLNQRLAELGKPPIKR